MAKNVAYTTRRFGKNLKNVRKKKGLSQDVLARKMGLKHRNALTDLETGKTSPTLRTLQRLASALEVSLLELLYPELFPGYDYFHATRDLPDPLLLPAAPGDLPPSDT